MSTDGAQTFVDVKRCQANAICHWTEAEDAMLMFVRSAQICGYGVSTQTPYDWKMKKVKIEEPRLAETHDQLILATTLFGRQ